MEQIGFHIISFNPRRGWGEAVLCWHKVRGEHGELRLMAQLFEGGGIRAGS